MIMKTLTRIALVVGCAVGLIAPMAQAQTDTQTSAPRILVGTEADRFLDLSPEVKARIKTECGPIANAHLRASCMDSLAIEADQRSMGLRDGLTGGGDGRMNPIDRKFQGPEKYDPHLGR
jgi:hypothetical protein